MHLSKISTAVSLIACALWAGGLVALGAIAAPVVFGMVPAPFSADAMTVVFRRFDKVAMLSAALLASGEFVRARTAVTISRLDLARGFTAVAAGVLAVIEGVYLSPKIEGLHLAGAIRGLNDLGRELDAAHHLAELSGKGQLLFLFAFIVLTVYTMPGSAPDSSPDSPTARALARDSSKGV